MIDDGDEDEEEYNNQSLEPIIDVLQIDNELSSTKYRFKKMKLCFVIMVYYYMKLNVLIIK